MPSLVGPMCGAERAPAELLSLPRSFRSSYRRRRRRCPRRQPTLASHSSPIASATMSMSPFDRYLQPTASEDQSSSETTPPSTGNSYGAHYDDHQLRDSIGHRRDHHDQYSSNPSASVQFQMPPFMYAGPPQLAHGGGAEVLPAGLFASGGGMSSSWLANNGFSSSA